MSLLSTVFLSTAMSVTPHQLPPMPLPVASERAILASRSPRINYTPDDDKTRKQRRRDRHLLFTWKDGPYHF